MTGGTVTGYADLAAAATLGVAARDPGLDDLPEEVRPGTGEVAERLLDAAAMLDAARRAAPVIARVTPPAPPAAETRPVIPPAADQVLQRVADDRGLLLIALAAVARSGRVLPSVRVPDLLERARTPRAGAPDAELAAALEPVLGEGGRWLARQHPDWRRLVAPLADGWPDGAQPAEALAWFARRRAADPAAARELLATSLADFSPRHRAGLIDALADGLGPGDRELLQAAAQDRSRAVAEGARELLARLEPGHAERAAAAARAELAAETPRANTLPETWPLWRFLPEDERADRVLRALATLPAAQALEALADWPAWWPGDLSRRVAAWLAERSRGSRPVPAAAWELWALRLPGEDIGQAAEFARGQSFDAPGPAGRSAWGRAAERLTLRGTIERQLARPDPTTSFEQPQPSGGNP